MWGDVLAEVAVLVDKDRLTGRTPSSSAKDIIECIFDATIFLFFFSKKKLGRYCE